MAYSVIFLVLTILFALFGARSTFAGDPPILTNPSNNTTVQSSKVEWQAPIYQLYSPKPYRVQVDDDSSFPSATINKDYYTDNTFYTPQLNTGTWYWRVKAKDISETWSNWSTVWSFILTEAVSSSTPTTSSSTSSSFTISNVPSQIDSTETFNVSVNLALPNNPNTTFYLKGAFKKSDGTNYFGLTKVSGSWIKNNKTFSDQYKITTNSSDGWSGNLEIQPDILDSGYEGGGDYIFKVGRYTDSGSLTWSNEVTIKINAQEVILEDDDSDVLGAAEKPSQKKKITSSKDKEYSLEKYIKIASPASIAATQVTSEAEVKGEKQKNYISWVGILMVVGGIGLFIYVYLRSKGINAKIFDLFRRRD